MLRQTHRRLKTNQLAIYPLALALSLVSWSSISAQSFQSNSRLILGTESNKTASVAAGDLDGDGDLDIVVANGRHWPQQNFIFLNDGRSRFPVMRPLGIDRSTTYACEIADLDGDGDLDLATGNDMGPCKIFLNDGKANFTFSENFGGVSSVRNMTVADIDGDGDQDILLACRGRANRICLNDGRGHFQKEIEFGTKTDSTIAIQVADINGDGHRDLVLANRDRQSNAWLLTDGAMKFDQRVEFGDPRSQTRAVTVADFDADGKLDWALANIGQANQIFLGDGKGGVKSTIPFGGKESQTYDISSADLDRDGDIDIVVSNAGQPNVAWFNDGSATDFQSEVFDGESHATYGLTIGDVNGDGRPDIITANSDALNQVFLNRTTARKKTEPERVTIQLTEPEKPNAPTADDSQDLAAFQERAEYQATDWPNFRGTGYRGIAEGFRLPTDWNADANSGDLENVLWQIDVPGLGHSSPVIAENKLFLLTAVAKDGKAELVVGPGGGTNSADDNGIQDWILFCYDKSDGKELWRKTLHHGRPRASRHGKATHANTSVCVAGDRLVSFLGSEGLFCHDLDGNLLWQQDLGVIDISKYGKGWGFSSSPTVRGDRIVLLCDDPDHPFLSARKLSDGTEVWRVSRKGVGERNWATPLVYEQDGKNQIVVNGFPWIVSYGLTDGEEIWRIKGGGDNPVPTPFEAHGLIYMTNAHGGPSPIYAIRPSASGELGSENKDSIAWTVGRGGSYMSTPVVYGDQIYLGQSSGVVRTFNALTGKKLKERRLGSKAGVIASLVAGDGKIFCASENGTVYVLQPGPDLNVIAENKMDAPCFATPAISEGTIFIRSSNRLTAIKTNEEP